MNILSYSHDKSYLSLLKLNILSSTIINTIGSVDDLIENLEKQMELIMKKCVLFIDSLSNGGFIQFKELGVFEKGVEVGSSNYSEIKTEDSHNYIRVGDLLNGNGVFIKNNLVSKFVRFDDVLVAFDGAPGRNGFGFVGGYSSGLYKLICRNDVKGLLYFSLNSIVNKKIIEDHSKGTTILHASEAIKFLVCPSVTCSDVSLLNNWFCSLVKLKHKTVSLKNVKSLLLNKYFSTSQ